MSNHLPDPLIIVILSAYRPRWYDRPIPYTFVGYYNIHIFPHSKPNRVDVMILILTMMMMTGWPCRWLEKCQCHHHHHHQWYWCGRGEFPPVVRYNYLSFAIRRHITLHAWMISTVAYHYRYRYYQC